MKARRKICIVTGSRAEYGLLYWLMKEIQDDPSLELQVVATGMHLAPEFGMTIRQIEMDGIPVIAKVDCLLASDSKVAMAKSLGLGIIGFADVFEHISPDVIVVLGDRFEILAAAQAAAILGFAIAHISGGEVTVGAIDEWIRHAISKVAWLHFAAAEPYRLRLIQLGESPERVFNVGDPGLDSIRKIPFIDRPKLFKELELPLDANGPVFLVTYHPATLGEAPPHQAFEELLRALNQFPQATIVITKPNADSGGRQLGNMAEEWALRRKSPTICVTSLGQFRYINLMRHSDVVIGNSSSGIVEAPALKIPTVNVGNRQLGRLKATSVIDCDERCEDIVSSINQALSQEFKSTTASTVSLYGDSDASVRIKNILGNFEFPASGVLAKVFYDL